MHEANFCVFCDKICHHFRDTSAHGNFLFPTKFCEALPDFTGAVVLLQSKTFSSGVKTIKILQFTRHDLKKKVLTAPTIT